MFSVFISKNHININFDQLNKHFNIWMELPTCFLNRQTQWAIKTVQ